MNKRYGNFFEDVSIAIKCECLKKQVRDGSEIARRRLNNIIDPIYNESLELEAIIDNNSKKVYANYEEASNMASIKFKFSDIKNLLYLLEPTSSEEYETSKCVVKIVKNLLDDSKSVYGKLKTLAYLKLAYKYKFKRDYDFMSKMISTQFGVGMIEKIQDTDLKGFIFNYNLLQITLTLLEGLTPRQVIGLFPIEKTYDGYILEMKDYYSSMECINKIGIDTKLTRETAKELLMDCQMGDFMFEAAVDVMSLVSDFNNWDASDIMCFLKEVNSSNLRIVK